MMRPVNCGAAVGAFDNIANCCIMQLQFVALCFIGGNLIHQFIEDGRVCVI
jgi:hypothetical protein